jgi:hypothetical protein
MTDQELYNLIAAYEFELWVTLWLLVVVPVGFLGWVRNG